MCAMSVAPALSLVRPPSASTTLGAPATAAEFAALGARIAAGELVPVLGPGLLALGDVGVPITTEKLAMELHARVPVGAKLRGNMWGTAQFIEQRRHRKTLVSIMADIFKTPVEPSPFHSWLANKRVPLIVDCWYDAAISRAFLAAGRADFVEVQGVTRALEQRDVWTKSYGADGKEVAATTAGLATTVLYKPHGSVSPASNFLIADSDYVEVLTEIDIQTPIPDVVKQRRTGKGFVFLGCRFDDQMLRTYARQIMKRACGPRFVVLDFEPTRMEERFFAELEIEPIAADLAAAVASMTSI